MTSNAITFVAGLEGKVCICMYACMLCSPLLTFACMYLYGKIVFKYAYFKYIDNLEAIY